MENKYSQATAVLMFNYELTASTPTERLASKIDGARTRMLCAIPNVSLQLNPNYSLKER